MNIDVFIGNPPFQDRSDKSKGRKLYLDITEKIIGLYGKEMIFLTPSTLSIQKRKRLSLSGIKGLKLVRFDISHYFNVPVHIIMFHLKRGYNNKIKIIDYNQKIHYVNPGENTTQLHEELPTRLFNRIKKIGSKNKLFIGDVTTNGFRQDDYSSKYKYKIHINILKNKIQYSSVKPKLYKKKKIVIHMGKAYNSSNFLISTENFAQYQNMIDIDKCTDKQVQNIKSFLFNDLTIQICKKFREFYKTGFNNIIYFFPMIDFDREYITEDIIKIFEITSDELDYLYSKNTRMYKISEKSDDEMFYSEGRNERHKETAEVFTPPDLVNIILDTLEIEWNTDTFCDPTCGSGNFLVQLAKRGVPIYNLYGVDLFQDNINQTHERLESIYIKKGIPKETIKYHLNRNIIKADALDYHYQFWWHNPLDNISEW